MKQSFNIHPDYAHIKPTHMVKIKSDIYNSVVLGSMHTIGSKMPAVVKDLGFNVLGLDGRYYYMSIKANDIEVVGCFKDGEIINVESEVDNG